MTNEIDAFRLDKDPELKPLLGKGASLIACLCFAHWIRGYEPSDIGPFFELSVDEAESNIALVKQLLPHEVLSSQIQIRDEIKAIQAQTEERGRGWSKDAASSAKELIDQGRNPGHILKKLHEEISSDIPVQVVELLKENKHAAINNNEVDLAVRDSELIAEMRAKDKQPVKSIMTGKQCKRSNSKPDFPGTNIPIEKAPEAKRKGNCAEKRITFRLDDTLYQKIQIHCHEIGIDLSALIRTAIVQHMGGESASKEITDVKIPAEALARTAQYQVAGSDLKENLRESFLQILAMAYVTTQRWHRTPWVKQLYQALLPLQQYLETDCVRQD